MNRLWQNQDISLLTTNLEERGEHLAIIIGENGSGKSFLLNEIAKNATQQGRKTVLISGPIEHRFSLRSKRADKTLVNQSTRTPNKILRKIIRNSFADYGLPDSFWPSKQMQEKRFQIGTALESVGFEPYLGIMVKFADFPEEKLSAFINALPKIDPITGLPLKGEASEFLEYKQQDWVVSFFERIISASSETPTREFRLNFGGKEEGYKNEWEAHLFVEYEKLLKEHGILEKLDILVTKEKASFSFKEASSGEISKIATLSYISSVVKPGMHIIIDEPETSLHPTWQKEFVEGLIAAVGYTQCKITIATHSPLIAVGAKIIGNQENHTKSHIFSCDDFKLEQSPPESLGVDSLLETHFDVIPPESHHLSKTIVRLLRALEHGEVSLNEFEVELLALEEKIFDGTKQYRAFKAAREMAGVISKKKSHDL